MSLESVSREILTNRAVGQFPISIATSLAIESLIGIHPDAPSDHPPIQDHDALWVNMRTLIRNLMGSTPTESRKHLTEQTVAEYIVNEMRAIEAVCVEHGDGRFDVAYYKCTYSDLSYTYNKAILKAITSPGQKAAWIFEEAVLKVIDAEYQGHIPYLSLTRKFPEVSVKALMISHYPVDLLQRYKFDSLTLLESHTGAVKPPNMWNTKLHNGRELDRIPFDRMTVQLFGDGVTFTPMNLKVRQKMIELAEKNKWTPMTTKDFVIYCVVQNRDPALEALVKSLYRI